MLLANIAYGKESWSSSGSSAEFAVDGDLITCFSTAIEDNPWWVVDLGEVYSVLTLQLTTISNSAGKFIHVNAGIK